MWRMWAVRRPHGSARACQGRHRAGTVWGIQDELSSLRGAGTPGAGVIAPGSQSPGYSPWAKPSVIPTGAGSGGREWFQIYFLLSKYILLSRCSPELPSVGKAKPTARAACEGGFTNGTERVVTRLEEPRPGFGSQDTAPCPGAPATPVPWRLQLPGGSARPAPLYVNGVGVAANPPAGWRRHVARRFLSLCASLSFLGRHLVLAACWYRGLRRAQVRGPAVPASQCVRVVVSPLPAALRWARYRGSSVLPPWAVLGRSPKRGRASDPLVRGLPWFAGPRLSRGYTPGYTPGYTGS